MLPLIALSMNNWNEEHKKKALMITNVKSIEEDLKVNFFDIQNTITILHE